MENMMSRVFAVCEPTYVLGGEVVRHINLKPAAEFGDVQVLLSENQSPFNTVPVIRTLRDKLANFSDEDYIVPVGDPVLMSMVAMVASDINNGKVKYLKWDRHLKKYYPISTDVSGKAM